jgi:hypothetical protein
VSDRRVFAIINGKLHRHATLKGDNLSIIFRNVVGGFLPCKGIMECKPLQELSPLLSIARLRNVVTRTMQLVHLLHIGAFQGADS